MWWKNILRQVGTKIMIATSNSENLSDIRYIENRIAHWLVSKDRMNQLTGEKYYIGQHDILNKKRTVIGECGEVVEVNNLPNNQRIDNQYAKYVDQKKNYILGKPITLDCEDEKYVEDLNKVFDKRFRRMLKSVGENALNGGIAWVCPYYDFEGKLRFRGFPAYEILPFWNDTAHTDLEMAVRFYEEERPKAANEYDTISRVELFTKQGIKYFTWENGNLVPDVMKPDAAYIKIQNGDSVVELNWNKIPLVAFKLNAKEIPLISRCKSLQDAVNDIISAFKDNMEEDSRNTIIVLDNYDGQNLGEFRKNLAQYGAVKVRSGDGAKGDVRTLQIEVNYANYESILAIFRTAIKHNCRGYDYSDLNKAAADPNQMNIKSILSDVDIDANDMEIEFQAAFDELIWFANKYLGVDDDEHEIDVIFNRDGIINEVDIMQMLIAAGVKIPNKILLHQVPFIDDVEEALELLKEEEQEAMDAYNAALPMTGAQPKTADQRQNRPIKQAGGTVYGQPKPQQ